LNTVRLVMLGVKVLPAALTAGRAVGYKWDRKNSFAGEMEG
jgi:hypothetical protein